MTQMVSLHRANATARSQNAWKILLVCFFAMVVDGFDTATIAYVAPSLSIAWHIPHAALTPAFVMTSVGAVLGYVLSGPLAARLNRGSLIAGSMVAFGLLSFASAYVQDIVSMSAMRFLTAVCLGCVVPTAISCAADQVSDRNRAAGTIYVTTGLSAGAAFGGLLASELISRLGWPSVFIAGGIFPLLLLPFAIGYLRYDQTATIESPIARSNDSPLESIWAPGIIRTTLLIWAIAFSTFLVMYQFMFWIPTLLMSYGFSPASTAIGSMAGALGGVAGNLLLLPFVGRFGVHRVLISTACLAIACIGILSTGVVDKTLVLWLIAGIGAGTTSGCVGQATLAVLAYPPRLRTKGVGFAAAVGRVGAIIGPAAGGGLLTLGLPAQQIIMLCCVPILIVVGLLIAARKTSLSIHTNDRSG